MEVVDVVQKCVNLMESIYWSQLQTRAYKTHCHDITLVVCKLWPTLVEALQKRNPNLCEVPGAEYVLLKLSPSSQSVYLSSHSILSSNTLQNQFFAPANQSRRSAFRIFNILHR